ncbi:MAG: hypothetical protein HN704_04940 [Bacteroidetes bacterium]|nr:hypothetical protein [Bacteroidota bacterium]MBT6688122.1 hypothetical protein [Bacteroidota bacterium]MBT7143551.1 hypothetical protein [Bacteroidota bacterium]MBT7490938.1 hypothetical protein [Bacteroidota bacterium]
MKKLLLSLLLVAIICASNLRAQTATGNNTLTMGIPAIALLATTTDVTLELTTTTAGEAISGGQGTAYVQISSIVASGLTRKITATVTGVPTGTALSVSAVAPSGGNSGGTLGTGETAVSLVNSDPAVDIVTGIGSCFTGVSATDGYTLTYDWDSGAVGDYGTIVEVAAGTATVVLTITEDQ